MSQNQFGFKQIKRMKSSCCEFLAVYILKKIIRFFLPRTFSAFKICINNVNRIAELSCWTKEIIGVVMSFVLFETCLPYSFRFVTVQRSINSINKSCYGLKKQ